MSGAIQIVGKRTFGQDLVFNIAELEFTQEQFDLLYGLSQDVRANLQQSFNLRQDFGEDILLLCIGDVCRNEFGAMNPSLCHVVYRLIDSEIETGRSFSDIEFIYP